MMKKKASTTVLVLVLCLSLCVPAFGATDIDEPVSDLETQETVESEEPVSSEDAGLPGESESSETQEEIFDNIQTSGTTGDCTWEFDEASGEMIISGTGRMDKYASMADTPWADWSDLINSVRIGNEVTYVSNYAFANSHIDSIVIPDSVTEIGEYAFYKCTNLSKVTLGSGLKKLGAGVFQTSDGTESVLTEITIPPNVEDIASHVFGYTCVSQAGEAPQKINDFLIKAECGSAGYYYAKENEFLFETTRHHFDEREVVKEPTYYDYGEAKLTCVCGETKTKLIKKLKRTSIEAAKVTVKDCTYTGKKLTPAVTVTLNGKKLKKNTDYIASYKNNINSGKAIVIVKGKGKYTGTVKKNFSIKKAKLANVKLQYTSTKYNAKAKKPKVTVTAKVNGKNKKLKKGTDYTVSYKNNKNVGTATVIIKGKGNYQGTVTKKFTIKPYNMSKGAYSQYEGSGTRAEIEYVKNK